MGGGVTRILHSLHGGGGNLVNLSLHNWCNFGQYNNKQLLDEFEHVTINYARSELFAEGGD